MAQKTWCLIKEYNKNISNFPPSYKEVIKEEQINITKQEVIDFMK